MREDIWYVLARCVCLRESEREKGRWAVGGPSYSCYNLMNSPLRFISCVSRKTWSKECVRMKPFFIDAVFFSRPTLSLSLRLYIFYRNCCASCESRKIPSLTVHLDWVRCLDLHWSVWVQCRGNLSWGFHVQTKAISDVFVCDPSLIRRNSPTWLCYHKFHSHLSAAAAASIWQVSVGSPLTCVRMKNCAKDSLTSARFLVAPWFRRLWRWNLI